MVDEIGDLKEGNLFIFNSGSVHRTGNSESCRMFTGRR